MPAKPKPALPDPAAVLPGEADILAKVIENLADYDVKLVYSDWLEERNDPRGSLLRNFVTAFRAGTKLPKVETAPKPWRALVGITLMSKLRGSPLEAKAEQLLALARPMIVHRLVKSSDRSLPIGASKLSGNPDMPAGAEWPKYKNEPLAFLGQYNLADLQASPVARELPATGLLSVFCLYDELRAPDDFSKGTWRVFHYPDASELVRRKPENELPDGVQLNTCRLKFTESVSLPCLESPWKKELLRIAPAKDDADHTYRNFIDDLGNDGLLGYPPTLHIDVLGKKSVRHLLTLGDYGEWGWIDGDVMYFSIAEDDLKQGQFDRVRMRLENY